MHRRSERGSVMMELVLALPFLWIIIALSIGFGAGWLARHRAAVLVREHAFVDASTTMMSELERAGLGAVRLSGDFNVEQTGAGLSGNGLEYVFTLLAGASNAHKLCFQGERQSNTRLLPTVA